MYKKINKQNYLLKIPALTLLTLGLAAGGWRCAAVKAPSGGPKDTTPPRLISATPPSGTLNIKGGQKILLQFSEYIDENTVENGFSLLPLSDSELKIKYRDDAVSISLPDTLIENQTYILTIGRQLKDERGVALEETRQLAYSTGDRIEERSITGNIYFNEKPVSVHLWDMSLIEESDSIFARRPHYVTDAADDGSFSFRFLRPSLYQVLAIDQSGASLGLNTERSGYGVYRLPFIDLKTDSAVGGIDLPYWREPALLNLSRVEWIGQYFGKIYFTNILQGLPGWLSVVTDDSASNEISTEYFIDPLDSSVVIVVSEDSVEADKLMLRSGGLLDIYGQELDSAAISVRVGQKPDTNAVELLEPTLTSKVNPEIGSLRLVTSKPLVSWPGSGAFNLLRDDSIKVDLSLDSLTKISARLNLVEEWESAGKYLLEILGDSLVAVDGTTLEDSLLAINITVADLTGRGGIEGQLADVESPAVVTLSSLENSAFKPISLVNSDSKYSFDNLSEGFYRLTIFQDMNQNQEFDFGNAYPFSGSEWFYLYPDTVEVRANWIIELPKITPMEVQ